jgi:hypothetical protein
MGKFAGAIKGAHLATAPIKNFPALRHPNHWAPGVAAGILPGVEPGVPPGEKKPL